MKQWPHVKHFGAVAKAFCPFSELPGLNIIPEAVQEVFALKNQYFIVYDPSVALR